TSKHALQEAIRLARSLGAQLELIHIYEDIIYLIGEDYINYEELQKTVRSCGEKMLADAEAQVRMSDIEVETRLISAGNERVADVIVTEAERWQAELIVLGTHGHSGFSRLLLGSVAEGVARAASIPVLLIRETASVSSR